MKTKILLSILVFVFFNDVQAQWHEVGAENNNKQYYPKLPKEQDFDKIKTDLENNLRNSYIYCAASAKLPPLHSNNLIPTNVLVFDDRIELTFKRKNYEIFYFKDLADNSISAQLVPFNIIKGILNIKESEKLETRIGNKGALYIYTASNNTNIADDLFYIRYKLIDKKLEAWLNDFKPIAENYRSLEEKPAISEEQRECIVQANLFAQQKNYNKAIELYKKAYQINSTSFPAAFSNLALLFANLSDYQSAIYYMKLYLLLEPEAENSRSSQDKIYEWKAMLYN